MRLISQIIQNINSVLQGEKIFNHCKSFSREVIMIFTEFLT
ncbi:unnamed protein product [Larinioides sclopetarius]|uniref:Uncharacterized protein n=1 Tax=Larinioides sclopetarius TaxID=280406 RepID=A0AAV2ABH0_9ARAC